MERGRTDTQAFAFLMAIGVHAPKSRTQKWPWRPFDCWAESTRRTDLAQTMSTVTAPESSGVVGENTRRPSTGFCLQTVQISIMTSPSNFSRRIFLISKVLRRAVGSLRRRWNGLLRRLLQRASKDSTGPSLAKSTSTVRFDGVEQIHCNSDECPTKSGSYHCERARIRAGMRTMLVGRRSSPEALFHPETFVHP